MAESKDNKKLDRIKKTIVKTLKKHDIKKAGIFGSYVRGEQKRGSDIDVLIEFNGSLLKLVRLERELEYQVKIKVDLLTYEGINPLLKKIILNEEVRII